MKVNNRIDTGESHIQNTFGHNFNRKPFTGEQWNIKKEPPKPLTKPADFTREKTPTPGPSKK